MADEWAVAVLGELVGVPSSAYAAVVPTALNITTDAAVNNKKKRRIFLDMTLLHSILSLLLRQLFRTFQKLCPTHCPLCKTRFFGPPRVI